MVLCFEARLFRILLIDDWIELVGRVLLWQSEFVLQVV